LPETSIEFVAAPLLAPTLGKSRVTACYREDMLDFGDTFQWLYFRGGRLTATILIKKSHWDLLSQTGQRIACGEPYRIWSKVVNDMPDTRAVRNRRAGDGQSPVIGDNAKRHCQVACRCVVPLEGAWRRRVF